MKYILEIDFEGAKDCVYCPLRDKSNDSCNVQPKSDDYETYPEQLENCPLIKKN